MNEQRTEWLPPAPTPVPTPSTSQADEALGRPQRKPLLKRIGSTLLVIGAVIAKFAAKAKALLLLLPKAKLLTTSATIVQPGAGYSVNDILTVSNGTFTTPDRLRVLRVDGAGAIQPHVCRDGHQLAVPKFWPARSSEHGLRAEHGVHAGRRPNFATRHEHIGVSWQIGDEVVDRDATVFCTGFRLHPHLAEALRHRSLPRARDR